MFSISATPDGGVIIAGGYRDLSFPPIQIDGYLIKLDSGLFVGLPEIQENQPFYLLQIFPNPTCDQLNLKSNSNDFDFGLNDITGKAILKLRIKKYIEAVDVSHIKPGLYYIQAISDRNKMQQKIIIN